MSGFSSSSPAGSLVRFAYGEDRSSAAYNGVPAAVLLPADFPRDENGNAYLVSPVTGARLAPEAFFPAKKSRGVALPDGARYVYGRTAVRTEEKKYRNERAAGIAAGDIVPRTRKNRAVVPAPVAVSVPDAAPESPRILLPGFIARRFVREAGKLAAAGSRDAA